MGISSTDLAFLNLSSPLTICEIGTQAFHGEVATFREYIEGNGLGTLHSLDVTPEATHHVDLNFDPCPDDLRGRCDLVINGGTTEHVANQLNAFTVIHDLTKVGCLMYHAVPLTGFTNHGLVNYNMRMFFMLCRANGYEPVNLHVSTDPENNRLNGDVIDFASKFMGRWEARKLRKLIVTDSLLRILLRKKSDAAFRAPLDLHETMASEQGDEIGRLLRH